MYSCITGRFFSTFFCFVLISAFSCREPEKRDDLALLNQVATNQTVTQLEEIFDRYGINAAEYYLDTAFHQKENKSVLNFYRYYYHKAYVNNHFAHDYNSALEYISVLIDRLEQEKIYDGLLAEAYFVKGDTYIRLKNFPQAYRYYSTGIKLCQLMDDRVAKSRLFDRFGLVLYRQKYYQEARKYFTDACTQIGPEDTGYIPVLKKQELLDNIGLCYTNEQKLDSAMIFYDSAMKVVKSIHHWQGTEFKTQQGAEGIILGNMAKVYLKRGETQKAIDLYRKSISLTLASTKQKEDAGYSLMHLADIFLEQGKAVDADRIIDSLKIILKEGSPDFAKGFHKNLLRLQRTSAILKKDWERAAMFADENLKMVESEGTDNEKRDSDINDVLMGFEKEQQMIELRKENQVSKNINALVGVLFLLSVVIVFVVYFSWRNYKKRTLELEGLNKQIKEQKAQLEENNTRLQQLNQEKDKILSIAAHDLRNPIAAVKSIAMLIEEEDSVKNDREVRTYLNLMEKASDSAMELINEILILAKLKSATDAKKETVSTNEFLRVTVNLLRNRADEKGIEMVLLPAMPDVDISINEERFRRAVSNLVINAVKFSHKGKKIWIGASVLADRVHIYIKDEGIGIPDQLKGQVFDTFSAAKRPGTSDEPAYGLGLSIVKQIVGEHNGSVWFESEEGKGTTFYIAIPAQM